MNPFPLFAEQLPVTPIVTDSTIAAGVHLSVLRLDLIHPIVSGNKLYKLFYFLQKTQTSSHRTVLTFGGAFSNHLVATAYACQALGIKSIGVVRGQEAAMQPSHTLALCTQYQMQLHFVTREQYKQRGTKDFLNNLAAQFGDFDVIPEGGFSEPGAYGAAGIMEQKLLQNCQHICVCTGTNTTLAGLLQKTTATQTVHAFPALKGSTDILETVLQLNGEQFKSKLVIHDQYHFGGYAKHNNSLIQFMNDLYAQTTLPTDKVYTAKMMYGILAAIDKGFFEVNSTIVAIHSGGLQGNASLPAGTLIY